MKLILDIETFDVARKRHLFFVENQYPNGPRLNPYGCGHLRLALQELFKRLKILDNKTI